MCLPRAVILGKCVEVRKTDEVKLNIIRTAIIDMRIYKRIFQH
jgi:hypothetical protein